MINAVDIMDAGRKDDGRRIVDCFCVGDSADDVVPTDGSTVTGLKETDVFAVGSVYMNVPIGDVYIFGGQGSFVKIGG